MRVIKSMARELIQDKINSMIQLILKECMEVHMADLILKECMEDHVPDLMLKVCTEVHLASLILIECNEVHKEGRDRQSYAPYAG